MRLADKESSPKSENGAKAVLRLGPLGARRRSRRHRGVGEKPGYPPAGETRAMASRRRRVPRRPAASSPRCYARGAIGGIVARSEAADEGNRRDCDEAMD